jgi:acetate kinase
MEFLGIRLDATLNRQARGDADVAEAGAPVRALVVPAREDLEIARETRLLVQKRSSE